MTTYIIYKDGNIINAKNENTGSIDFIGTDISTILKSIAGMITGGETIYFKGPATYAPSSQIIFTKSIRLIADGNVTFNWNILTRYLFTFNGTELGTTTLTGYVAIGSNSIPVTSVGTAIAGDLLLIYDNTVWNPTFNATWKTGELHEISSISGNTVTITDSTINTFTAAQSDSVILIRPITVEINGITVNGVDSSAAYEGLSLNYNKNSMVQNSKFQKNGLESLEVIDSYNTTIKHNNIGDNIFDGYGYGVAISDSSAYTTITNNYFYNGRHCITLGGHGVRGQPRDTMISFNTFADSQSGNAAAVIDAHPIAESYYIYNNIIYAPVGISSAYGIIHSGAKVTKIIGNRIIGGYGIRPAVTPNFTMEIANNTFTDSKHIYHYWDSADSPKLISIKDNIIIGDVWAIADIYNATSFIISGNQFLSTNNDDKNAIYLHSCTNGLISNNTINNGGTIPYGIVESGASDYNRIYDNNLAGIITASHRIISVGTNTKIRKNAGYLTENDVLSNTFAIDSTGVKTVTIAHGLAIIPSIQDCYLTVVQNTTVDDWAYNMLKIVSTNATNVIVKINISVPSATVGATAKLALRV